MTQWSYMQSGRTDGGTSGSSRMRTSDLALAGTASNWRGGLIPFPWQVYFAGMEPLGAKAGLVIFIEDLESN